MATKEKIVIDEELCTKLEKLHYEYNSYAQIEKSYIDDHRLDPDGSAIDAPIYVAYHKKTLAAFQAYEEAKDELMRKYDLLNVNWQLNFKTKEIEIS